jgi:hypothetical protein
MMPPVHTSKAIFPVRESLLDEALNKYGKDGWELVTVGWMPTGELLFTFKRGTSE